MSAACGPSTGNSTITITGLHLYFATAVKFGSTAAVTFSVISDSTISAVAPALGLGTVDVTATTAAATSATSSADQYTYLPPTQTTLTTSVNPATVGQPVTFSATVTNLMAGGPTPTGTVRFFDGTTALDTETLDASGTGSFATPTLAQGTLIDDSAFTGTTYFTWTGGTLAGTGQFNIRAGAIAAFGGSAPLVADGQAITNNGAVTFSTGAVLQLNGGSSFLNNGSVTLGNGAALTTVSGVGLFDNEGSFSLGSSAAATVRVTFTNGSSAAIAAASGSTLTFQSADSVMLTGTAVQNVAVLNEAP